MREPSEPLWLRSAGVWLGLVGNSIEKLPPALVDALQFEKRENRLLIGDSNSGWKRLCKFDHCLPAETLERESVEHVGYWSIKGRHAFWLAEIDDPDLLEWLVNNLGLCMDTEDYILTAKSCH